MGFKNKIMLHCNREVKCELGCTEFDNRYLLIDN